MLSELWQYLSTPCNPLYRKSGHLKELIAIQARYKRVNSHWQEHLDKSKQFIGSVAAEYTDGYQCIVLGSGLLLDIPLQQLATLFKTVLLIDIAHHKLIRKQISKFDNIHLVEHDITGLTDELINHRQPNIPLPQPKFSLPVKVTENDLIISANLLSQLPITPLQYARQHHFVAENNPDEKLYNWAHDIIASHLDGLKSLPAKICLITDISTSCYDKNNQLISNDDLLYGNTPGKMDSFWNWQVAPYGEITQHTREERLVHAYTSCNS